MPPAVSAILDTLGFSSPVAWAALIYGIFEYLERVAAARAKRAMTRWIQNDVYQNINLTFVIVSAFDIVYTSPLLSAKAFFRSACISMSVLALWLIEISSSLWEAYIVMIVQGGIVSIVLWITFIVCSDYISLFIIRLSLTRLSGRPIVILPISILFAAIIIVITFVFAFVLSVTIGALAHRGLDFSNYHPIWGIETVFWHFVRYPGALKIFEPALLVHLWIIIFACGAVLLRLCYPFFKAVQAAQWCIKSGAQHPFRAIGIVSTLATFFLAVALKVIW